MLKAVHPVPTYLLGVLFGRVKLSLPLFAIVLYISVSIVLTLLWPIGVPGFLFYTMYMVRAAIMDDDPDTLQKYNFVLNDYDKEHW